MKNLQTVIRRQLLAILMFLTSAFSIAISRFEQNPQSCGMISVSLRKKKKYDDGGRAC